MLHHTAMRVLPRHEPVSVSIINALSSASPACWQLTYEIRNHSAGVLWLVDDASLSFAQVDDNIALSLAREPMQPGVQVMGYFEPQTVRLDTGASLHRSLQIDWPCPLSDIWNPTREASPAAGSYSVTVRIGYACTAAPPARLSGENVEAVVLTWQRQVSSRPVRLSIAPYAPLPYAQPERSLRQWPQ